MCFQELWDFCAQNKTSEISTRWLSGILGLPRAEQHVTNLKKMHFQQMHVQNFWDSCAQNKSSEISKMHFQEFWDSCAQNNTSVISQSWLSGILGLPCAEQNVRNLNKCIFRNSGTPVRRTKRRKYQKCTFVCFWTPARRTKRRKFQQMSTLYWL